MNLVVDFYNDYKRIASLNENVIYHFIRYIFLLERKFRTRKTFFAVDGTNYFKKKINSTYKQNRKKIDENDPNPRIIQQILLTLSHCNIIIDNSLEADDVAYCFCKKNNHCICTSEDFDWLYLLTANSDIKVYRKKHIIHKYNFQLLFGYPVDKIGLSLFLKGDSKDGVKKPFRIKGDLVENVNQYESIKDYVDSRGLDKEKITEYRRLILPITHIPFKLLEGKKSKLTFEFIRKYRLNFLKQSLQEGVLRSCV